MKTIGVELDDTRYDVLVGAGARERLVDLMPPGTKRAAIVTQEHIPVEVDPGLPHERFLIADGEAAKTMHTIEELGRAFARFGLTRGDAIVAVGGGVVTDTAGFAAAVYHRGIRYVNVATSLLAQVDAAVGGKTGVNLPEGKNLMGAFWQPSAVICDTDVLATLPPREYLSGLGEMAKYHFLGLDDLENDDLETQVARCVAHKAKVVAADERESGLRATLNYGHTLAHALETAGQYDLRHGEALGIGLVFAAELALRLSRIDDDRVEHHRKVIGNYGLPSGLPEGSRAADLLDLMARDKKAVHGITFVLDGPGGVEPVLVETAAVTDTLTAMGAA